MPSVLLWLILVIVAIAVIALALLLVRRARRAGSVLAARVPDGSDR